MLHIRSSGSVGTEKPEDKNTITGSPEIVLPLVEEAILTF
jgi:hypothetical protein